VGQIFAWWTVLNSTLVLKLTGIEGMGLYSMVLLAGAALDVVPTSVAQVLYPRMAEEYGRTGKVANLLRILRKPVLFTTAGLVPVVVAAWFLVGPVMRLAVPAYVDAVPAARWALLLVFVSALMPVTSVFNTVRRQDLNAIAVVVGMASYGGSLAWLIRDGASLVAFPQAMLIGRVVFVVLCYLFVWRLRNKTVPIHMSGS
jgi:O-antigen/teichoic acid export membrane protein